MKKTFKNIIFMLMLLFPIGVFATGNITVSPASLSVEVGSSKTFTISAYNTIGDVSISSSNSGIASVNTSQWSTGMVEDKQTKTGTITVTGKSVGSATITIYISDAATFDSEDLSGQTRTVTVNVVAKPTNTNTTTTTTTNNNKTTTTAKTQKEKEEDKKAKEEQEAKTKEEAEQKEKEQKLNLNKATVLVKAAEKSLLRDDYEAALEAVNKLDKSTEKENLLKRLDDVKFKVAVKEECKVDKVESKPDTDVRKWTILSAVLLLIAIGEFIYIIIKQKKDND